MCSQGTSGGLQHGCQQQPLQPAEKRQATKAAVSGAVIKAMSQLLQLKSRLLKSRLLRDQPE